MNLFAYCDWLVCPCGGSRVKKKHYQKAWNIDCAQCDKSSVHWEFKTQKWISFGTWWNPLTWLRGWWLDIDAAERTAEKIMASGDLEVGETCEHGFEELTCYQCHHRKCRAPVVAPRICCHMCADGQMVGNIPLALTQMILCPDCGNKRCPKATNHQHECTNSNEPGQNGSVYG